jgi:hypothetical protein
LESRIAEQDILEQYKEVAQAAVRRLQELTAPLNAGLKDLYSGTQIDSATDELTQNTLKTYLPSAHHDLSFRWQRCTRVVPFDLPGGEALRLSRAIELFSDGTLVLLLMVDVSPEGVMGNHFQWRFDYTSASVGSVEAEKMIDDGVREMTKALQQAVEVFIEQLPDVNGT